MAVSQDAVGDSEQASMMGLRKRFERPLVTVLGSSHEVDVCALCLDGRPASAGPGGHVRSGL
jgi:hypothetical protein